MESASEDTAARRVVVGAGWQSFLGSIAVLPMLVGIALLSIVTANIAAYFVEESERDADATLAAMADLAQRLDRIEQLLADRERAVESAEPQIVGREAVTALRDERSVRVALGVIIIVAVLFGSWMLTGGSADGQALE